MPDLPRTTILLFLDAGNFALMSIDILSRIMYTSKLDLDDSEIISVKSFEVKSSIFSAFKTKRFFR